MPLHTDEELKALPEYEDLDEALRRADEVFRFRAYRFAEPGRLDQIAKLSKLQSLSLTLTDVSAVLPILAGLEDLQVLYIQACEMKEFPRSILELPSLRSLTIGNSHLIDLPVEIARLERLEELRLAQNELMVVPDSIGCLVRLRVLGLSFNKIEVLPDSIGQLNHLEFLFLDSNRLTELPETLDGLKKLQRLNLNFNRLRKLPKALENVSALEGISLEHNSFEELPNWLSRLPVENVQIESPKRSLYMDWNYKPRDLAPRCSVEELGLYAASESGACERLLEEIRSAGLSANEKEIMGLAREAVDLVSTEPDDYSRKGSSRLGGFPDLPDESHFPKTDGLYWSFLAQVDLADIAPLNAYLPRSGLLSFFIDSTESLQGRVLYFPLANGELTTVRHGGEDEMFEAQDDYTGKPYRIAFSKSLALPHTLPGGFDDAVREAFENWQIEFDNSEHQINGYTFTQHESPEAQAADRLGGQANEWVPLLRLGWDHSVGFCFWDAGTLTFSIHREDLRREDFSRVYLSLESS